MTLDNLNFIAALVNISLGLLTAFVTPRYWSWREKANMLATLFGIGTLSSLVPAEHNLFAIFAGTITYIGYLIADIAAYIQRQGQVNALSNLFIDEEEAWDARQN